jgi:phytoene dehydrogenase-like protein
MIQNKELPLEKYGLNYIKGERCFGSPFKDDDYVILYRDINKTLECLGRQGESNAESWKNLFDMYLKVRDNFIGVLFSPIPSLSALSKGYGLYKSLGKEGLLEFLRLALMTPRELVEENFESEKVRAWLAAWGFHPDYETETSFGGAFAFIAAAMMQDYGLWIPEGGGGMLTQSLADCIKGYGGEVRVNATVNKILLRNGKASGVKLEDGEEIEATKAVIASIEPHQLFLKMIGEENLPSGFVKKVKRYRFGIATLKMDFAINEPLKWKSGEEVDNTVFLHLVPSVNAFSKACNEAIRGILPEEPYIMVSQPSVVDNKRAPEGKGVIWVVVRSVPYNIKGDSIDKIKGDKWEDVKEAYAERVINIIDSYAPNFKSSIIGSYIQSPVELEKNNLNLVKGCIVGGTQHLFQNIIFRPYPTLKPYRTPFEKLYMTGSPTWPGGGITGASGRIVAGIILKDIGISRKRVFSPSG